MLKESAIVMSYDAETGLAKVKCQSQSVGINELYIRS